MSYPETCPACGIDLNGEEIPVSMRSSYSPPYRFSRVIGIYDMDADMTIAWKCPDCGHQWERK